MNRAYVLTVLAVFAVAATWVSSASAGTPAGRQAQQRARIHTGVKSGNVVPREARRLAIEQRHIQKTKRRMRADDGKLGPAERARLDRMQDRASRHIFRAKHNARAR
ncbi:MAG: hypothetical protein QF570_21170 [Myxococcota bacterium]|jgi:hypothetical protein|nr:hypothetical protein [Myxococcota bacterium]